MAWRLLSSPRESSRPQGTPKAQKDPKKEPGNLKIRCCKVTEACKLHMIEACTFKKTCKLQRIEPCALTKQCNLHMIGACTFTKHCKTHGIGTPASTKACNLHMIRTARGKTFGDAQSRNGRPGRAPDIVIYIWLSLAPSEKTVKRNGLSVARARKPVKYIWFWRRHRRNTVKRRGKVGRCLLSCEQLTEKTPPGRGREG